MTGKLPYNQLPLNLSLKEDATFENFHVGKNSILISALKTYSHVYLWGHAGVGKTHLLEAACAQSFKKNISTVSLSFKNYSNFSPDILERLEFQSLVCLDDIDYIIGIAQWEEALFHFYNRAFAHKTRLLISAQLPPQQLEISLSDLKSRFSAGLIFQIQPLSDEEKLLVLKKRAHLRGIDLPAAVGTYLLSRYSRNMSKLIELLDVLDKTTLATHRKLTIPLVRRVLHEIAP